MRALTIFKELRERRLFQMVVGYAAAAWVALEVVDQLTQQAVLPQFLYELALVWAIAGFPAALVLGWYHGEKGEQRATALEVLLLLAIAVGGAIPSVGIVSDELARRLQLEAAAESALDLRRIAVLHFDDLTPRGGARHLADGFTEALIDELSATRQLDVVSRNGVAPFRGIEAPRDSIARVLEAGTLVDGTVERVGDRLRVGVRLVDGLSGAEFRRAGFERPASELLAARDEIVESTAALLREWLGDEVRLRTTKRKTENVTAWALYHRGDRARKDAEAALRERDVRTASGAFEEADTLLSRAEVVDPRWPDPPVLRGQIAFRRARLATGAGALDAREALEWIEKGLAHVGRALELDPNHARALEGRGGLKYQHHLLEVVPDPERQAALLDEARGDLERAVELDPSLASAHQLLSILYGRGGRTADMVLAARRAYEEDAYLENADVVLWRIVTASYNLEQFTEARRWCETGQRRFPEDHRFGVCELLLMTTPAVEPDVPRAWELLARLDSLSPDHQAEWERLRAEFLVGGVLARAGLADSARNVWLRARSRVNAEVAPNRWLHALEAYMRTHVRDYDEAFDLLKLYAAVNPGFSPDHNWWWRELRQHPRYPEIAGTQ